MRNLLYRTLARPSALIALVLVFAIVTLALLGPWLSPYPYDEIVGTPFGHISSTHWLGTDYLGRDTLSRFLNGGETVLMIAVLATSLAFILAVPLGIFSGLRRGKLDFGLIALSDIIYALPPAIFLLVLLAATGPSLLTIIFGIVFLHIPRVFRIVRLITIDVSRNEFVEAAFARGEKWISVCLRDILPNILAPVFADFGVRLCGSIILSASLSYLGLGPPPPYCRLGYDDQ